MGWEEEEEEEGRGWGGVGLLTNILRVCKYHNAQRSNMMRWIRYTLER